MNMRSDAGFEVVRALQEKHDLVFDNEFVIEHVRDGEVIGTYPIKNNVKNVGINKLLNVFFGTDTKPSAWYIGLIDNSGTTNTETAADTMASHDGWVEFTSYSESTRQTWTPTTPTSSQSVTGTAVSTFTITATGTVKGIFLASDSTKSGTTGVLWSTAQFTAPASVLNTDQFRVTYTLTLGN